MRKKLLAVGVISLVIAMLISISSVLNTVALKNNYLSTNANNNAIMAGGVVNELEYSLMYGKSLENYYGIEDLLGKIKNYCDYVQNAYITKLDGEIMYEENFNLIPPDTNNLFFDNVSKLGENPEEFVFWIDGYIQNILIPISDGKNNVIAGLGMTYSNNNLDGVVSDIVNQMVVSNIIPILLGVLVFIILFLTVKHEYRFKRLLAIIIPVIIVFSTLCGVVSYREYYTAYTDLVNQTADMLSKKITNDINFVIGRGVEYSMLTGISSYFDDILKNTGLIDSITLVEHEENENNVIYYKLNSDEQYYIRMVKSSRFVNSKLREIIIDIFASIVTSILISAEVIIFVAAVVTNLRKLRKQKKNLSKKTEDVDVIPIGVVRGLFFFFAMFQYMSVAFVPIVMAQIYRPIFGLPYEIMLCIPLTAQIFMSVFSSWICGAIVSSKGWRPVAFFGISVMVMGAVMASFAAEPLLFILSQIVFGFGLGCAKTSFDIFGVIVSSSENIEEYTANTNAGLIAGLSCSAALGAVIAGTAGFSGAFLVMAVLGVLLLLLLRMFSVNIIHHTEKDTESTERRKFDVNFVLYILLLIIPYFFVSMYLDYFFPVFADKSGMSTGNIGHVFLLYGISTAYIGTYLCGMLSKRVKTLMLMSGLLFLMGAFLGLFALNQNLILAVAFVLFIGIIDGIMPSLQYRYVFSLPISRRLGVSRVLGIEGAFIGIVRGISPLIFSFAMIYGSTGLLISGIIILIAAVLFKTLNRRTDISAECPAEGGGAL